MNKRYKHHKYTWTKASYGSVLHRWELVCSKGAIHFTANFYKDGEPPSCGLEFHHLEGDGAPDHVNFPLTGGRCWHDGTSLYANEGVWPYIKDAALSGNHEAVFSVLEFEAHKHFYDSDETLVQSTPHLGKSEILKTLFPDANVSTPAPADVNSKGGET